MRDERSTAILLAREMVREEDSNRPYRRLLIKNYVAAAIGEATIAAPLALELNGVRVLMAQSNRRITHLMSALRPRLRRSERRGGLLISAGTGDPTGLLQRALKQIGLANERGDPRLVG